MDNERIARKLVETAKEIYADLEDYMRVEIDWESYIDNDVRKLVEKHAEERGALADYFPDDTEGYMVEISLLAFSPDEFDNNGAEMVADVVDEFVFDELEKKDGIEAERDINGEMATWKLTKR